jgi:hypothetical protein
MKRILILAGFLATVAVAQAQVVLTSDTVYHTGIRGGAPFKMYDTLKNTGGADVNFNWNINLAASKLPVGYTVQSVCESSGQCYSITSALHASVVPANSSIYLYPEFTITGSAPLDTNCVLVISTDLPNVPSIVFSVKAVEYATSIANTKRIGFDMYPLPATQTLNIYHNDPRVTSATVYNLLGRKLQDYNTPYKTSGFSIPVADLMDGIYLVELKDAQGIQLGIQRFSKQ